MDSVRKAKGRLKAYPQLMASCSVQATAYGKCVAEHMGEVKKGQCQAEFEAFKKCVRDAAKKAGTRM